MADEDWQWLKANSNPSNDSNAAGGAKTTTALTGGATGEVLTRLKAAATGTPDNSGDLRRQWQKLFGGVDEEASESALGVGFFLGNGLKRPAGAGIGKLVTTGSEAGKTARFIGVNLAGTAIVTLDVNLTGTAGEHSIGSSMLWVERVQIRDTSSGAPAVLSNAATVRVGSEDVGSIRAGLGWATGEVQIGVVASIDDSGTSTNRLTAPAGITYSRAYSEADALSVRNDPDNADLDPGEHQGVWLQQTLQPGMPPFRGIQLDLRVVGAWG